MVTFWDNFDNAIALVSPLKIRSATDEAMYRVVQHLLLLKLRARANQWPHKARPLEPIVSIVVPSLAYFTRSKIY